jgi:hypothetical protein
LDGEVIIIMHQDHLQAGLVSQEVLMEALLVKAEVELDQEETEVMADLRQ